MIRSSLLPVIATIALTALPAAQAAIGHPKRKWKEGTANACWTGDRARLDRESPEMYLGPGDGRLPTAAESDRVREIVTASYSRDRVGVEFTGFDRCAPNSNPDVRLLFDTALAVNQGQGIGSIGDYSRTASLVNRAKALANRVSLRSGVVFDQKKIRGEADGVIANAYPVLKLRVPPEFRDTPETARVYARFEASVRDDLYRLTVLHEFGHLSGLFHEERRKDMPEEQPKFCFGVFQSRDQAGDHQAEGATGKNESRLGTAFDPFSIMNYCRKTAQILYRQSELVCAFGDRLVAGSERLGQNPHRIRALLPHCDFIAKNPLPVALTPRDVAGLRKIYLDETPSGVGADYRASPTERKWLEILDLASKIYF